MRIGDAIFKEKVTKGDIQNLRAFYNQIVESVLYCQEDIKLSEQILADKYLNLEKLKTQAKLTDTYINAIIQYDDNKNRKSTKKKKDITLQYLSELSEMCKKVPTKPKP